MPRKTKGKKGKRGKGRKSYTKKAPMTMISYGTSFPQQAFIKLNYSSVANELTSSAGVPYASLRFALNNLVDPDISGGGVQPPMFDNLKEMYQNWRVVAVTIKARCENYESFPTHFTLVSMYDPTTNSPTALLSPSTYNLMALPEIARSERKTATQIIGDSPVVHLSKRFILNQIVNENYLSSVNFIGEGNSAPARIAVCDLIAQSGGVTNSPSIGAFISWSAEYEVIFFNPKNIELATND